VGFVSSRRRQRQECVIPLTLESVNCDGMGIAYDMGATLW
jgi:hypothetical protein